MPDHVHMLLNVPAKIAVSSVVGYVKGKSTIHRTALYEEREELRRAGILGTRAFRGYGGAGYRNDQEVHRRPRERGPKAPAAHKKTRMVFAAHVR